MRKFIIIFVLCLTLEGVASHNQAQQLSMLRDLPDSEKIRMGLHKLNAEELRYLDQSILKFVAEAYKLGNKHCKPADGDATSASSYTNLESGHWIKQNIDRGTFIILEDGSLWELDRLERLNASLWLKLSNIKVVRSTRGSLDFNYLLINTDDGEAAHAKYIGKR